MGKFKDWFNKPMAEAKSDMYLEIAKKIIDEDNSEGEQNMPSKEELAQTTATSEGVSVERGVVVFHDESGSLRYQQIGKVSLEDLTFYRRYLDLLEESFWKAEMEGAQNATV